MLLLVDYAQLAYVLWWTGLTHQSYLQS